MTIRRFLRSALVWPLLLYPALPAPRGAEAASPPAVEVEESSFIAAPISTPPTAPKALVTEPAPLITEPPAEPEGSDPFPAEWQLSDAPSSASPMLPPYPVELNPHVQRFLDLFQSGGKRGLVERWLHKSGQHLGMIQEVFRQKGLPEDLAYTAMIESGFNPVAVSRAGAKGLWQFMAPTARRYGLKVDRWVDERLDPQKSTSAAADYLRDLFDQFGSWFLAQAAYNAGEVRVARAVQTSGTDNFWTIARGRLLKEETKRFVPAIQAATLIAREPVRYGFDVTPALPEPFDVVTVPFSLELAVIGKLAHISPDVLRGLNPELLRSVTPPDSLYPLRVPQGSGERVREGLKQLSASDKLRWTIHRVKRGQSLQGVARIHGTTPHRLRELNGLTTLALKPDTGLVIPLPPPGPAVAPKGGPARASVHVVTPGETLSRIAGHHGVALAEILHWNGLTEAARIYPGDRVKLSDASIFLDAAP